MHDSVQSGQPLQLFALEHQAGRLIRKVSKLTLGIPLSSFCCASLTPFDFAFGTLVYEPMRAGMASTAVPKDKRCI